MEWQPIETQKHPQPPPNCSNVSPHSQAPDLPQSLFLESEIGNGDWMFIFDGSAITADGVKPLLHMWRPSDPDEPLNAQQRIIIASVAREYWHQYYTKQLAYGVDCGEMAMNALTEWRAWGWPQ